MAGKRRLAYTPRARQDLIDIWCTIARDNPPAADATLDRTEAACLRLTDHPMSGRARDDIRPGMRYLVIGNYIALYRIARGTIDLVRVVHGRRDLFELF